MSAFKKYRSMLRHKRFPDFEEDPEEKNAEQYMKYTAYLLEEYRELQKELPKVLTSPCPQEITLNQYLLNVQNGIDALKESPLYLRNRAIFLLISFITEGMLWNAPISCIRNKNYKIGPYIAKREEAIQQFQEFSGPLSKVSDIIRSYAAKPYSKMDFSEVTYIDTAPEVDKVIDDLTELYLRSYSLPTTKKGIVHTNIVRLMRASVLHAPQFSILPYYLTVMFIQKRDILEQPVSADINDTTLYHIKVNSTELKGITQEEGINLYLQIKKIIDSHRVTNVPSPEMLAKLSDKERIAALCAVRDTVFAAANVEYASTEKVADAVSKLCIVSKDRISWLEEQWEKLYYYRDFHGNAVNKKEVISQCASCEEGKILTALNTVLQPKNRIRILAHQKLDAESRQALQRLDKAILQTDKTLGMNFSGASDVKMFARVEKFFKLQRQDISLLFLRMQFRYFLIDEMEVDPFEETLLESLHHSIFEILSCIQPVSYLEERWSYHITSKVRLELLPLQEFLLKKRWSKDILISLCMKINVNSHEFFSTFQEFIREIDTKNKLDGFWKNWGKKQTLVQEYILKEAFQIALLKIEEYFIEQIMTSIWECICERGAFLYNKREKIAPPLSI